MKLPRYDCHHAALSSNSVCAINTVDIHTFIFAPVGSHPLKAKYNHRVNVIKFTFGLILLLTQKKLKKPKAWAVRKNHKRFLDTQGAILAGGRKPHSYWGFRSFREMQSGNIQQKKTPVRRPLRNFGMRSKTRQIQALKQTSP